MKKYEQYNKKELQDIIDNSFTYKEVMQKIGYASSVHSKILEEIAQLYDLDISMLNHKAKQKWQNFSKDEIIKIINESNTYKEILLKLGYKGSSNCNYIIDDLASRLNISLNHLRRTADLTGKKINLWTVLRKDSNPKDNKNVYWICQCECGKIKSISYSNLMNNKSFSCGHKQYSKGEIIIERLLKELNYDYISQYSPKDIKSYKNYPLSFDFYIPSMNTFIEFQGEQHYYSTGYLGGEDRYIRQFKNDNIKRKYCKENGYKLIEIPYTNLNKLSTKYLSNLITN